MFQKDFLPPFSGKKMEVLDSSKILVITRPHGIITKKTTDKIFNAVKISDFTLLIPFKPSMEKEIVILMKKS